jgi:type IV pilus assembly protein PilY1
MGDTWSEPVITKVKVTVNCTGTCPTYDRWVAVFAGGYDPLGDPNLAHNSDTTSGGRATATLTEDYDASNDAGTSRAGRAVFMVDIKTGEVLAMKRFHTSTANGDPNMKYAFAARPAVFDVNFDGYADVIYIGDLGGQLWKWVVDDPGKDPVNGTGDVFQPDWPFFQIMKADGCSIADGCASPHFKSFFSAVQGALIGPKLWLVAGTGERTDLEFAGTNSLERNRLYVFRDQDPFENESTAVTAGSARFTDELPAGSPPDFVDATTLSGPCAAPNANAGYYLEGEDGEKFITDAEIFFGVVLTGSYVPTAAASACEVGGEARLYGYKLFCGEGIFPPVGSPTNPKRRFVDVGGGLPNQPRVSVGPVGGGGGGGGGGGDPCEDMVVVITSDGETLTECPGGRPDSGVHVQSWRDL